jgi:hypothetical protein
MMVREWGGLREDTGFLGFTTTISRFNYGLLEAGASKGLIRIVLTMLHHFYQSIPRVQSISYSASRTAPPCRAEERAHESGARTLLGD